VWEACLEAANKGTKPFWRILW